MQLIRLFPFSCLARLPVCLMALVAAMCLAGCNLSTLEPEKDGGAFLHESGYDEETIERVACRLPLSNELVRKLSASEDINVLYMLGDNTHLSAVELQAMVDHPNEYARRGAAQNPKLTIEQMRKIASHDDEWVCKSLVYNQSVPVEILRLMRDREMVTSRDLVWNRNCPPEAIQEIESSSDLESKRVMEMAQRSVKDWGSERHQKALYESRKYNAFAYKKGR